MVSFELCCCVKQWNEQVEEFCKEIAVSALNQSRVSVKIGVADGAVNVEIAAKILNQHKSAVQFEVLHVSGGTTAQMYHELAQKSQASFLMFCDVQVRLQETTLSNLQEAILTKGYIAMQCREIPLERVNFYHPQTHETDSMGGHCCCVERDLFQRLGGFDEAMTMDDAWTDFSYRLRLKGIAMHYVPKAVVCCAGEIEDDALSCADADAFDVLMSGYLLRLKYWPMDACREWLWKHEEKGEATNRREQIETWNKILRQKKSACRRFYKKYVRSSQLREAFLLDKPFRLVQIPTPQTQIASHKKQITVIVRTYRRPQVLRQALENLAMQTDANFEVIVAEDGAQPTAQSVVQEFENRLSICYLPANAHVGRCEIGNLALKAVKTPYACFLDDDDYWYADYVETVSHYLNTYPECGMFCSGAVLARVKLLNEDGSAYEMLSKEIYAVRNLSRVDFCLENAAPIQAVVFRTELFFQYGGFDPSMDAFEDWDLWLRYSAHTKICTIEKTLSLFKIPGEADQAAERHDRMLPYRKKMLERVAQQRGDFTAQEVLTFLEKIRTVDDTPLFQQSAEQLCRSNIWRVGTLMRWPLAKIASLLFFAARGMMCASWWFGPIEPETPTREGYREFIEDTQRSPYFRIWRFLRRKKH